MYGNGPNDGGFFGFSAPPVARSREIMAWGKDESPRPPRPMPIMRMPISQMPIIPHRYWAIPCANWVWPVIVQGLAQAYRSRLVRGIGLVALVALFALVSSALLDYQERTVRSPHHTSAPR